MESVSGRAKSFKVEGRTYEVESIAFSVKEVKVSMRLCGPGKTEFLPYPLVLTWPKDIAPKLVPGDTYWIELSAARTSTDSTEED